MDTTTYASVAMLPKSVARRSHAFRPAGSRTSSVGSVDDQAIAAGSRHFSSEVGEQDQFPRWKRFWTD